MSTPLLVRVGSTGTDSGGLRGCLRLAIRRRFIGRSPGCAAGFGSKVGIGAGAGALPEDLWCSGAEIAVGPAAAVAGAAADAAGAGVVVAPGAGGGGGAFDTAGTSTLEGELSAADRRLAGKSSSHPIPIRAPPSSTPHTRPAARQGDRIVEAPFAVRSASRPRRTSSESSVPEGAGGLGGDWAGKG